MLNQHNIPHTYREYDKHPLTEPELREVLSKLGVEARTLLRKRDKAYKEHSLTGTESDDTLVPIIVAHPTLLQRPIGVTDTAAAVGRPIENLLALAD